MIRKDSPQSHGSCMQDALVAETAKTAMPMNDLNSLTDADVTQRRKEGEDGGKGSLAVNDKERDVVDFESVIKIANALAIVVAMRDDNDFVAAVDELTRELVDM